MAKTQIPFPDLPDMPALLRSLVAQVPPGRRLPEPIYWADRLSRAAVK